MPRFYIQSKSDPNAGLSGFYNQFVEDPVDIQQRKELGLSRTIFSGLSLLLGAFMIYISMHYIPAFLQPREILQYATGDNQSLETYEFDKEPKLHKLFAPYYELFHLDRAYMKAGQQINIKYDLPEGSHFELEIVQCSQAWVIEIFKCKVVGQFNTQTKRQNGIESFVLNQTGFYHFRQTGVNIPKNAPYEIIWKRWI